MKKNIFKILIVVVTLFIIFFCISCSAGSTNVNNTTSAPYVDSTVDIVNDTECTTG